MYILSINFISFTAQIYIMHCTGKAKKGNFDILGGMALLASLKSAYV